MLDVLCTLPPSPTHSLSGLRIMLAAELAELRILESAVDRAKARIGRLQARISEIQNGEN